MAIQWGVESKSSYYSRRTNKPRLFGELPTLPRDVPGILLPQRATLASGNPFSSIRDVSTDPPL